MQISTRSSGSERRTNQSQQSPPDRSAGMSSGSGSCAAPLIVERYQRWASPDRIGPVQDPVCAKYVVAWWIAVDRAGFIRKELPPDLDPEAACGRPAPRAGHVVGRGHETARLMMVGSALFCVRACGRFGTPPAVAHANASNAVMRIM